MNFLELASPLTNGLVGGGEDLAFSLEFDEIREARRFDDPSLAQGEWVTEIKEANWSEVVRICERVLSQRSKDLRVAAWWTEARFKQAGLPGLGEGYQLLLLLCERFWDGLHPLPEGDDQEERARVFDWLLAQTERMLKETPLTQSAKGSFSRLAHLQALADSKRSPGRGEDAAYDAERLTLEQFEAALRGTAQPFFAEQNRYLGELQAQLAQLQAFLDQRMGEHAPSFRACLDVLADIRHFFERHVQPETQRENGQSLANQAAGLSPSAQQESQELPAFQAGAIRSRDQAMLQLGEIAAFFRATEPHSPVAYLAEKAVKWGNMPLHEWLRAVLKDDGSLLRIQELLGLDNQASASSE